MSVGSTVAPASLTLWHPSDELVDPGLVRLLELVRAAGGDVQMSLWSRGGADAGPRPPRSGGGGAGAGASAGPGSHAAVIAPLPGMPLLTAEDLRPAPLLARALRAEWWRSTPVADEHLPPARECVVVQVAGGLGNQLFQYAAARSLADRRSAPLVLDLRWFAGQQEHSYGLDALRVRVDGVVTDETTWRDADFAQLPVVSEQGFAFDPAVVDAPAGSVLAGYFQSPRYLIGHERALREDVMPVAGLGSWTADHAAQLLEEGSVSLHVRRGDYLTPTNATIHGSCTLEYYRRCLRLLARVGHGSVLVFSDDPLWAEEHVAPLAGPGAAVVAAPPDAPPFESMRLMSLAHHAVLANSTFSWWGAWLRESPGVTLAPRPWFSTSELDTRDLLPGDWLTLDRGD